MSQNTFSHDANVFLFDFSIFFIFLACLIKLFLNITNTQLGNLNVNQHEETISVLSLPVDLIMFE